jgi:hypothetical protein
VNPSDLPEHGVLFEIVDFGNGDVRVEANTRGAGWNLGMAIQAEDGTYKVRNGTSDLGRAATLDGVLLLCLRGLVLSQRFGDLIAETRCGDARGLDVEKLRGQLQQLQALRDKAFHLQHVHSEDDPQLQRVIDDLRIEICSDLTGDIPDADDVADFVCTDPRCTDPRRTEPL